MEVLGTNIMRGPNCWSLNHHRLIVINVAVQEREVEAAREVTDFKGEDMGKYEGEARVGYLFAVIALQLQRQAGVECSFKSAEATDTGLVTRVIFEYADEQVGLLAAAIAANMTVALLQKEEQDVPKYASMIQERWDATKVHQLTMSMVEEAIRRKIPCIPLDKRVLIQMGYGANQKRIQKSVTGATGSIGVKIASNKESAKALLRSLGVPVPGGKLISRVDSLKKAIKTIGFPIVIKPIHGSNGRGVGVNIRNYDDAVQAFHAAKESSGVSGVIVERFVTGWDYRLLVIGYKFVAAAKRTPAMVTGNGVSTIGELIEVVNRDPRRGTGHSKPLTTIKVDENTRNILKNNDLSLDAVLPAGKSLQLKSIANISAGGTSTDVTECVHPDNVLMAERIAHIVGLDICGMDIISPDICVPLGQNDGAVVEVNSAPGFRLHMEPTEGTPRNVAGAVIDMLFPAVDCWRIPIVAFIGPGGVGDLIVDLMRVKGHRVGSATSKGIYIQNIMILQEDARGYKHAEVVLKDPTVDLAVFECSASEIMETGLAFHYCDIGIVIDAGETAAAAAVVPGAVLPSGYAILNADDEIVHQMGKGLSCKIGYISLDGANAYVAGHCRSGGAAVVVEDGDIMICDGEIRTRVGAVSDIEGDDPETRGVLACVLVGWINGMEVEAIRRVISCQ